MGCFRLKQGRLSFREPPWGAGCMITSRETQNVSFSPLGRSIRLYIETQRLASVPGAQAYLPRLLMPGLPCQA
jgi:hypothetical protein